MVVRCTDFVYRSQIELQKGQVFYRSFADISNFLTEQINLHNNERLLVLLVFGEVREWVPVYHRNKLLLANRARVRTMQV